MKTFQKNVFSKLKEAEQEATTSYPTSFTFNLRLITYPLTTPNYLRLCQYVDNRAAKFIIAGGF